VFVILFRGKGPIFSVLSVVGIGGVTFTVGGIGKLLLVKLTILIVFADCICFYVLLFCISLGSLGF